jgi:hypothetical protein
MEVRNIKKSSVATALLALILAIPTVITTSKIVWFLDPRK